MRPSREDDCFVVAHLVKLRVADETEDPCGAPASAKAERHTHGDPESMSERPARDLDPGHEVAVGVMAERRFIATEGAERIDADEALRREDGVVRHRSVPF